MADGKHHGKIMMGIVAIGALEFVLLGAPPWQHSKPGEVVEARRAELQNYSHHIYGSSKTLFVYLRNEDVQRGDRLNARLDEILTDERLAGVQKLIDDSKQRGVTVALGVLSKGQVSETVSKHERNIESYVILYQN